MGVNWPFSALGENNLRSKKTCVRSLLFAAPLKLKLLVENIDI